MIHLRHPFIRRLLALLALLGPLAVLSVPATAWAYDYDEYDGRGDFYDDGEPGSGDRPGAATRWRQCRDRAWADYNSCLMEDTSTKHHTFCFFVWDLDNVSCNIDFLASTVFFWIK